MQTPGLTSLLSPVKHLRTFRRQIGGVNNLRLGMFTDLFHLLFLLGSEFLGSFLARYAESHVGGVGLQ